MNIELEPGEMISITTAQGAIVVSADNGSGVTLVTFAHTEGYKLQSQVTQNKISGQKDIHVWIQSATGL